MIYSYETGKRKKMPPGTQQHRVGEHWSAANPVPTIQKFMQHLESEKEERKAHEEEVTAKEIQARQEREARGENLDEATAHKNREIPKGKTRMVTDPTTGKNIEVEDLDEESMEVVKNPTVRSTHSIPPPLKDNRHRTN